MKNNPIRLIDPDGMYAKNPQDIKNDEKPGVGADGLTTDQWLQSSKPGVNSALAGDFRKQNREDEFEANSTNGGEAEGGPNANMHLSQKGLQFIENYEDFVGKIYDAGDGKNTIGYGYVIPSKETQKYRSGITKSQAEELLLKKLGNYEIGVQKNILITLTQNQFDALVMLNYNTFSINNPNSSVVKLINSRAGVQQLSDAWLSINKVRSPKTGVLEYNQGVCNRRQDEFELWQLGDYKRTHNERNFK